MPDRSGLHITVAAVVMYQDRFLCVEEIDKATGRRVLNQPAGHVEPAEDLVSAIQRELTEETGLVLQPTGWLGISQLSTGNGHWYYRVNFLFEPAILPAYFSPQDRDILALHWLSAADFAAPPLPLRSELVHTAIEQYRAGVRLPLSAITPLSTLSAKA